MKSSLVVAATAGVAVIAVTVYVVQKPSPQGVPISSMSSPTANSIPTPQYLFAHPEILKVAEQKCQDGGNASSLYCSNVHKAESLRLADQYRRSLEPTGAAR